jgi:hypothetical protein
VVVVNALRCNRRTVAPINEGGEDWCLALNGNQEFPLSDAHRYFGKGRKCDEGTVTKDTGYGRAKTLKVVVAPVKILRE